jgi:hypothetical protein
MLRSSSCPSSLFLVCGLTLSLVAGCSGSVAEPSGSGSGEAGVSRNKTPPPEGAPTPVPSTNPIPDHPNPNPVPMKPNASAAEIQARCADAVHGPVDALTSFMDLKNKVHGRWFACNRATASGFYTREAGIEFNGNGTWNLIREEADGTFVTLQGIDNQATWHEKYTDFLGYFQVNTTTGMVLTEFAFESAPRRMRTSGDGMTPVWFVPMEVIDLGTAAPPTGGGK